MLVFVVANNTFKNTIICKGNGRMSLNHDSSRVKQQRGLKTKEKIFRNAAKLFAEKGYEAVSIRKISSAVNIKESSIYNHYNNKISILENLFDYFSNEINEAKPTMEEINTLTSVMSAEEILKHIIIEFGQSIDDTLDHIATIVYIERFRNQNAAKVYFEVIVDEQVKYYTEVFALLIQKGLLHPCGLNEKQIAVQFNMIIVTLTNEYAMAKNNMADPTEIIAKMMESVSVFIKQFNQ